MKLLLIEVGYCWGSRPRVMARCSLVTSYIFDTYQYRCLKCISVGDAASPCIEFTDTMNSGPSDWGIIRGW